MSNVIHIASRRHQEMLGALRHTIARVERGEIGGMAFMLDDLTTGEIVEGYSGSFRGEPGRIGRMLASMAARLLQLHARLEGENTGT